MSIHTLDYAKPRNRSVKRKRITHVLIVFAVIALLITMSYVTLAMYLVSHMST